ncbi:MAG: hypothetical protein LBT06_18080 [Hungatella sp.]|nr:hypothetical protein [Hungatella sp.]
MREYQKERSAAETGVVRYLLDTPEQAVKLSVHALAEKGFSSSSTVIRLCHELGFSGYRELKAALISELAIRQENTREKMEETTENDSLEQIIDILYTAYANRNSEYSLAQWRKTHISKKTRRILSLLTKRIRMRNPILVD